MRILAAVLAALLMTLAATAQLQQGASCVLTDGTAGVCSKVSCAGAADPMTSLCCMDGEEPIFCCPSPAHASQPPAAMTRGSIARHKCEDFARLVFWEVESPVLMIDPGVINMSMCAMDVETLIVGGSQAQPMEFPHMAALGYGPENSIRWICGGSLISERFVLTVAHCMRSRHSGSVMWVRLGGRDPVTFHVVERFSHQGYQPPALYNDIALLKLEHDVTFSPAVRPACLYTSPGDPPETKAIASGWGRTDPGARRRSDHLMKVQLTLRPIEDCNRTFEGVNVSRSLPRGVEAASMICAGERSGSKDTCGGDSGGPLQIKLQSPYCMYGIIGLTSFGKPACGSGDSPAIYTRVSNYISWIENHVWPKTCQTN